MDTPLQVIFRGMEPSDAVRTRIEEKAARLEKIFDRITSCRVVVELPHRHRSKGKLFNVTLDIGVPGDKIVVARSPSEDHAREDIYVALRETFETAQRRLEEYARKRKGVVKTHEMPSVGKVIRLLPAQDCGFIATPEGREIYFHRNAVLSGFDTLAEGAAVRFVEERGDEGPQASTVEVTG